MIISESDVSFFTRAIELALDAEARKNLPIGAVIVFEGEIIAEAKIVHRGAMTAIGDVEVRDGQGTLIAKGLATYAITKK